MGRGSEASPNPGLIMCRGKVLLASLLYIFFNNKDDSSRAENNHKGSQITLPGKDHKSGRIYQPVKWMKEQRH